MMNPNQSEELREAIDGAVWAFEKKYGNSFVEWKNKDYDYAHTLPEDEQQQVRPELLDKFTTLFQNRFKRLGIETRKDELNELGGTAYQLDYTSLEFHSYIKARLAQLNQLLEEER